MFDVMATVYLAKLLHLQDDELVPILGLLQSVLNVPTAKDQPV